jgi:hypothetical protein
MQLRETNVESWAFTASSLICLFLIAWLTVSYKPTGTVLPKQVVLSVFMGICFLGGLAALLPSKCSRLTLHKQLDDKSQLKKVGTIQDDQKTIVYEGHHPSCGRFITHVLKIRNKVYCAGCSGLLIGALIAIFGSLAYAANAFALYEGAVFVFWFGFSAVLLGLLQYTKPLMSVSWIHFILNVLLVAGSLFMLIGVIETNGTLMVEMYFLVTAMYWILTRIALSNLEHQRICKMCTSSLCGYRS